MDNLFKFLFDTIADLDYFKEIAEILFNAMTNQLLIIRKHLSSQHIWNSS